MASEKPDAQDAEKPVSKEEFDRRDAALTDDIDKLEKDVFPPKPKPAGIGGMF